VNHDENNQRFNPADRMPSPFLLVRPILQNQQVFILKDSGRQLEADPFVFLLIDDVLVLVPFKSQAVFRIVYTFINTVKV
jgi:hypothetical protein